MRREESSKLHNSMCIVILGTTASLRIITQIFLASSPGPTSLTREGPGDVHDCSVA